MEKIQHKTVFTNGINMHVAEIGEGPALLFLHGFPELWYSWRHQMLSLSSLGYRAIAPDLRGYGDTDAPPSHTEYTAFHIVGDLVGLLAALNIDKVFLVAHDWGAQIAWYFSWFRPDLIKALVNTSVAFTPRNPKYKTVDSLRTFFGENYYICRFQEPGWAEKDFARIGTSKLIKQFLSAHKPDLFCIPKEGLPNIETTLPCWLSEEDINYYVTKYNKSGFTGGLNYYRALDLNWELTAPYTGMQVKVPVKFIVGDLDLVYNTPGAMDFIHNGELQKHVPFLQEIVIMEGVAHFLNQEKADEISAHIYDFIKKF